MSILRPSILMDFANAQMLDPRASFARASGGTVQDFSGTWRELLAGYLRFGNDQATGERLGLLMEGQRTNSVRNPRCEGITPGVLGAGGALPTNWSVGPITGATISVAAATTEGGLPCFDITVTPTGAGSARITFDNVTVSAGAVNAASVFCKLISGTTAVFSSFLLRMVDQPSGNVGATANLAGITNASLGSQRFAIARAADGTATTQRVELTWVTPGAGAAMTFRLGVCQHELGAFASSPILPAAGTPAAATRVADTLILPLSAAGIGAAGACTIFGEYLLPQQCPSGTNQTLLCIDDGTANNRFRLINANATAQIRAAVTLAGVAADLSAGVMTPGTPFRAAMRIDGAGNIAASLKGAGVVTLPGGPASGLTTLRIGHDAAGAQQAHGFIKRVGIIPRVVSDAALQLLAA